MLACDDLATRIIAGGNVRTCPSKEVDRNSMAAPSRYGGVAAKATPEGIIAKKARLRLKCFTAVLPMASNQMAPSARIFETMSLEARATSDSLDCPPTGMPMIKSVCSWSVPPLPVQTSLAELIS